MNILDKIIENKKLEVKARKLLTPLHLLKQTRFYSRKAISLEAELLKPTATGIIAEFKRKSPSKGIINDKVNSLDISLGYQNSGASAISILTDKDFFGGSEEDIISVRDSIHIPILRKEFIIDEYQIHESKSIGADFILLIAACLSPKEVMLLSQVATSLGMEVLLELHDDDELSHICDSVNFVGINNRSLKTFDVDVNRSLKMAEKISSDKIKIAESGIDNPDMVKLFRTNGYRGFLIGENFMKAADPSLAIKEFMQLI